LCARLRPFRRRIEKDPQQPIRPNYDLCTMIIDVHLYKVFRTVVFVSALICQTFKCGAKNAVESGHVVRIISLRCYKILMQLFIALYIAEGMQLCTHVKFLDVCPLSSVGEGTNLKMHFFLKI